MNVESTIKAVHYPDGNYFDDMRIDIAESHRRFDNLARNPSNIRRLKYRNMAKFYFTRLLLRLGIHEFLIVNGIKRRWIDDFRRYWSDILEGRPFTNVLDFFMLLHDYRKRQQHTLEWSDPAQHLENWQHPSMLYMTLHTLRRLATYPIVGTGPGPGLWKKVPKRKARILEYGCSLAPFYHCYREFFSHLDCRFVLADIPNYPFHYAKYLYRSDPDLVFVTIDVEDFSDPLKGEEDFDVIIVREVFEHLDDPMFIQEYLLNRLKPGGLFVFDYVKSEGTGLDHPSSMQMRAHCIRNILKKIRILHGQINSIDEDVGLCIAQKLG